jgi:hypothetical protein
MKCEIDGEVALDVVMDNASAAQRDSTDIRSVLDHTAALMDEALAVVDSSNRIINNIKHKAAPSQDRIVAVAAGIEAVVDVSAMEEAQNRPAITIEAVAGRVSTSQDVDLMDNNSRRLRMDTIME